MNLNPINLILKDKIKKIYKFKKNERKKKNTILVNNIMQRWYNKSPPPFVFIFIFLIC
jgi:hypothetical protein